MKNNKKGISLIVLVITIALLLIIVATTVSTILNKRYFKKADYSSFLENFDNYKDELEDYIGNEEFLNNGRYNRESLFAEKDSVYYNSSKIDGKTIKDIIPTISDEYINDIRVYRGTLIYTGTVLSYRDAANVDMRYFDNNALVINYEKDVEESLDGSNISVPANLTSNFTFEIVFKEKSSSYTNSSDNFVSSNGFVIYETNSSHSVYFGINTSDGKDTGYMLNEGKLKKITYTYNASKKEGTFYVNAKKIDSKVYDAAFNPINGITVKGNRDYYAIRVYDKALDYSAIKQNDYLDNLNYGEWEE